MDILIIVVAFVVIIYILTTKNPFFGQQTKQKTDYRYVRKDYVMTSAEASFYRRLEKVMGEHYYVFPQVHLSSLAINKTQGKYHKLGYQRINRRSVDYVLADKNNLKAVYAVELDDRTHDTAKGKNIDALKTEVLSQIGLPLIRFRNVNNLSDSVISNKFLPTKH